MKKSDTQPLAETLGKGYAYIQHGIDRAIGWGFERMRDAGEIEVQKSDGKIVNASKKALSFLGAAGDAYYKTYDKLKRGK